MPCRALGVSRPPVRFRVSRRESEGRDCRPGSLYGFASGSRKESRRGARLQVYRFYRSYRYYANGFIIESVSDEMDCVRNVPVSGLIDTVRVPT